MYTIVLCKDGKFHCSGRIQDGTERWVEDTIDEAIQSMIRFADTMNGWRKEHALTVDGIRFLREVDVLRITTEVEPYVPEVRS